MYKSKAIYFDGISSKPNNIELSFDEKKNTVSFVDNLLNNQLWIISNCNVIIKPHILKIETNEDVIREIKIEDFEFIYHFNRYFQEGKISFYDKLLRMNLLKWILFFVLLIVSSISLYIVFLPKMSDSLSDLVPKSVDIEIGDKSLNSVLQSNIVDSVKTNYFKSYLNELEIHNKTRLKIYVINSNEINAFALPNGGIIIYTKLLDKLTSSNQLNALLFHEISHINKRHTIRTLCKNLFSYLWTSLIFSDISTIHSILLENTYTLQSLSFSRDFEKEADIESIKLMKRNNLPVNGIIDLLNIISIKEQDFIPQFLSTHPIGKNRIDYNNMEIKKLNKYKINNDKMKRLNEIWDLIKKSDKKL